MTFKEFLVWYNERACEGLLGSDTAMICIEIVTCVRKEKFWRREKVWKRYFEKCVVVNVVDPINNMIKEAYIND